LAVEEEGAVTAKIIDPGLTKAASKENITESEFVECAIAISCNRVK
jgi:hypothetical protein